MIGYGNSVFLRTAWEVSGGVPPVNTVAPVISGGTSLGSVLTSTTGTWTGTPTISYTYQWYRGATLIGGATNSTYTIVVADSAALITCKVTATNGFGSNVSTSNAITAQTFTSPVNTVAPAISGTAQEGQIVTCSTGTWTGTPTITFAYQWKRNGSNIGSATNSTYTLVTADVSQSITCQVTGTNGVGSASATSNTITPTAAVDPDAQAFITAAGITNPTQQGAINTLVLDLKGYSIWTKFQAIYPIVGGTAASHKFNLKDPRDLDAAFRLTFATGWTHSATGMTPSNAYADTFLNPNTQLNVNSHSFGIYSRTNNTSGTQVYGAFDNTPRFLSHNLSGGNLISGAVANIISYTANPSTSLLMLSRTSSTLSKGFRGGVLLAQETAAVTSLPLLNFYLGARNNAGVATFYSVHQLAFAFLGDGLTDTDAANFYTAVQAYQTTLSRQV
jgi:hypothetical protein